MRVKLSKKNVCIHLMILIIQNNNIHLDQFARICFVVMFCNCLVEVHVFYGDVTSLLGKALRCLGKVNAFYKSWIFSVMRSS